MWAHLGGTPDHLHAGTWDGMGLDCQLDISHVLDTKTWYYVVAAIQNWLARADMISQEADHAPSTKN